MTKRYDATEEFKPFEKKETRGKHPRPRVGATAKRNKKMTARKPAEPEQGQKKKKK